MKNSKIKLLTFVCAIAILSIFSPMSRAADSDEPSLFRDSDNKELATRQKLSKGEVLEVFYDPCIVSGKIEFKETERNSQIHEDIIILVKKIADPKNDGSDCKLTSSKYKTKYKRSNITITAKTDEDKVLGTKALVVGPNENLSLGLNLPINNRKTLKYDSASGKLLPQDDAPLLYLSLDLTPGDVLTSPDDSKEWKDRFTIKAMVEASSHPVRSYGLGIGYRFSTINSIDLTGLSVFIGYFRAKQDTLNNEMTGPNQGVKNSWRWGISYDLGTALKWAKF